MPYACPVPRMVDAVRAPNDGSVPSSWHLRARSRTIPGLHRLFGRRASLQARPGPAPCCRHRRLVTTPQSCIEAVETVVLHPPHSVCFRAPLARIASTTASHRYPSVHIQRSWRAVQYLCDDMPRLTQGCVCCATLVQRHARPRGHQYADPPGYQSCQRMPGCRGRHWQHATWDRLL